MQARASHPSSLEAVQHLRYTTNHLPRTYYQATYAFQVSQIHSVRSKRALALYDELLETGTLISHSDWALPSSLRAGWTRVWILKIHSPVQLTNAAYDIPNECLTSCMCYTVFVRITSAQQRTRTSTPMYSQKSEPGYFMLARTSKADLRDVHIPSPSSPAPPYNEGS